MKLKTLFLILRAFNVELSKGNMYEPAESIQNVAEQTGQVFIRIKAIPLYLNFHVKVDKLSIYDV